MANGLDHTDFQVHQALHGYSDGHRLLACSTTLKPRDQKAMLIMSDVSGPSAIIGDEGYLTGYPLSESGVYALACTWAATEMARPGCVWTHTLLIDFADLAALPSMVFLTRGFRRPTMGLSPGSFEVPLAIDSRQHRTEEINQDSLERIIWALYEQPRDRIIASHDRTSLDCVFLLWAQQWPRLRRTFRFCTLSFGDRSSDSVIFDLQYVPSKARSIRGRFSGSTDADRLRPVSAPWIQAALTDLLDESEGKLRKFLRDVGGDLAGGREAFVPLCRLYQLIPKLADRETAIDEAIELLDGSFDSATAKSLRTLFVAAVARQSTIAGGRALKFILAHLDLLNANDFKDSAPSLGRALWNYDPNELVEILHTQQLAHSVAEEGLATLSVNDLIQGLQRNPQNIAAVLERRPDLIEERDLWSISGPWFEEAFKLIGRRMDRAEIALTAILAAKRADLAARAVLILGSVQVLKAICTWASRPILEGKEGTLAEWLMASIREGEALAEVFSGGCVCDRMLLLRIAQMTNPDFVPNNVGGDPWLTCVRNAKGSLDGGERQYLSAYLLARALGYRSHNQADLFEIAFDEVYIPASQSQLSSEAFHVIERRLPSSWFFDWDHCQRMRDAVVEAFVDHDLSPDSFLRVTRHDDIFELLTAAMARTGKGRRFLRRALQSMTNQHQPSERAKILQNAI
jgi:hypothetical protein